MVKPDWEILRRAARWIRQDSTSDWTTQRLFDSKWSKSNKL